jgi:nitroreductase
MIEKLVLEHRSIRKFDDKKVDISIINKCLNIAKNSSTSSFIQAYSVISITDTDIRKELYEISSKQEYVLTSPVFLVFIIDFTRIENIFKLSDREISFNSQELLLASSVDIGIFAQTFLLLAESMDLGGVFIGAIRNDPQKVIDILNLPQNTFPMFGMAIGYKGQNPVAKPRIPLENMFFENIYPSEKKSLKDYDAILQEYYKLRTNGKLVTDYSSSMLEKFEKELRPFIPNVLKKQGLL